MGFGCRYRGMRITVEELPDQRDLAVISEPLGFAFGDDPFGVLVQHDDTIRDAVDAGQFMGHNHKGDAKIPGNRQDRDRKSTRLNSSH